MAIITRWDFNSNPPDAATNTGIVTPSIGSGALTLIETTATFTSGDVNGGSSDPATEDNSGYNISNFSTQSAGDKTEGIRFDVSTVGKQNIIIKFDQRHSNTSSRYVAFQYTVDGTNFVDSTVFDGNTGEVWFNNRTVDLSGIAEVNNNANFGFRIVATFAPSTTNYSPSNSSNTYATSGTWRFDYVTVEGSSNFAAVITPVVPSGSGSAPVNLPTDPTNAPVTPTPPVFPASVLAIASTPGVDNLRGDFGSETVDGGDGADTIRGMQGNDYMLGNVGDDYLYGNQDNDYLDGNTGDDDLYGGKGNDVVIGGAGDDDLYGDNDNDSLYGDDGNDDLLGGDGNDLLYGMVGSDFLNGNAGNDTLYGGSDDDILRGGKDDDLLNGGFGNDTLYGDRGRNTLTGGEGADIFVLQEGGSNVITDFTVGVDKLLLATPNMGLQHLQITQTGNGAIATFINTGEVLAEVSGVTQLAATDFLFTVR